MAWRPVLTVCIVMLDLYYVTAARVGSGVEMNEVRLLLQKHETQIEALQRANGFLREQSATLQKKTVTLEEKVVMLEEKAVTLEEKVVTLEEKVVTLEDKVGTHQEKVVALEKKVMTLRKNVKTQEDELLKVVTIGKNVRTLDEKATTLEGKYSNSCQDENNVPSTELHEEASKTQSLTKLNKQDATARKINKRVDTTTDSVIAFHAILTHLISDAGTDHILQFDKIVTNIGGHYSANTGVFTCTKLGVYKFSWMIRVYAKHYLAADLVRNGHVMGTSLSGDNIGWSTGAASAITMLVPGDEVWLRVDGTHSSGVGIVSRYTMFNGFLLH